MNLSIIERNYARGLWNAMQVQTAVAAGVITQAQADAIIAGTQPPADMAALDEVLAVLRGNNTGLALPPGNRRELTAMRGALDQYVVSIAETPALVNENVLILRDWQSGTAERPVTYTQGVDVRKTGDTPFLCCQSHTHHGEAGWEPDKAASLWREYHGTSAESARAYRAPTGAHDMYRMGEYMVWDGGQVYHCLADTDRGPDVLPDRWEAVS